MPALRDLFVDLKELLFNELFLFVLRVLFELQRDARALGEAFDRLHEIERFVLPDEGEHVPAFVAAVAVEGLFARINVETWRALPMKRTERRETCARALQWNDRGNDIDNVVCRADLFESCWRD